jgi:DNA-binding response OmpR family regulator
MSIQRVLVVEDDAIIAADVEHALRSAGYEVCGVASSEESALLIASTSHPDLAVVDVCLSPGDGRKVARELASCYGTTVLFATAEAEASLDGTGAQALLPKPYDSNLVAPALKAAEAMAAGQNPGELPDHLKRLR